MKRRIIGLIVAFSLLIVAFGIWFDWNAYEEQSKTIPYEKNGIIFSITTFDGDNESSPFIPCLGHTWVSVENQSDHSIYIKNNEIKTGEILSFSIWAISHHFGLSFNLEPAFIKTNGRYVGRQSLNTNITESQLKTIENYMDKNSKWTPAINCSCWSVQLWNEVVQKDFRLKTPLAVYTPKRVQKALKEFDCVEKDKDFSTANGAFFYQNGVRTELQLCQ